MDEVVAERITHVIVPTDHKVPIISRRLELELETPRHRLYRITPNPIP
jgi:hypothetical protein